MSVYFIRVGGYFKIGMSDNPQRRFERLHYSSTRYTFPPDVSIAPTDRVLYKVIPGSLGTEQRIHLALDDWAVGLEWFLDEPPLVEFIDALPENRSPGNVAELARDGGWCEAEYHRVRHGRAVREEARWLAKRRAS